MLMEGGVIRQGKGVGIMNMGEGVFLLFTWAHMELTIVRGEVERKKDG